MLARDFYGRQFFSYAMNHAYFTPIGNVISQEKLQELYGQPKDVTVASGSSLRNNPPTVPQTLTSEDILNLESRFSSRSKDQVIKEQEMILQKIKQDKEQKMAEKKS